MTAQEPVYDAVVAELRRGRKTSHWIWFIFPQIAGLGHSAMAERYAIASLAEARAYLDHPLLGARLRECAGLILATSGRDRGGDPGGHRRDEASLVHDAVPARGTGRTRLSARAGPLLRRRSGRADRRAAQSGAGRRVTSDGAGSGRSRRRRSRRPRRQRRAQDDEPETDRHRRAEGSRRARTRPGSPPRRG